MNFLITLYLLLQAVAVWAFTLEGSIALPANMKLDPARNRLRLVTFKDGTEVSSTERYHHLKSNGSFVLSGIANGTHVLSIESYDFALLKYAKMLVEVSAETIQVQDLELGFMNNDMTSTMQHPIVIPAQYVRIRNYIETRNKGLGDNFVFRWMRNHKGATAGIILALAVGFVPQLMLWLRPDLFLDEEDPALPAQNKQQTQPSPQPIAPPKPQTGLRQRRT